jgi:hypothetical protein
VHEGAGEDSLIQTQNNRPAEQETREDQRTKMKCKQLATALIALAIFTMDCYPAAKVPPTTTAMQFDTSEKETKEPVHER